MLRAAAAPTSTCATLVTITFALKAVSKLGRACERTLCGLRLVVADDGLHRVLLPDSDFGADIVDGV